MTKQIDKNSQDCKESREKMRNYITMEINKDLNSRIDELAKKTGRPKVYYYKECLEKYIPVCEGIYLHQDKKEIYNINIK